MIVRIFAGLAIAAAVVAGPGSARAREGHDHGAKVKKVKKSKARKAGHRVQAGGACRPDLSCRRVLGPAERYNWRRRLNHSLSFLSHYSNRPASGRRVAPVHSV